VDLVLIGTAERNIMKTLAMLLNLRRDDSPFWFFLDGSIGEGRSCATKKPVTQRSSISAVLLSKPESY